MIIDGRIRLLPLPSASFQFRCTARMHKGQSRPGLATALLASFQPGKWMQVKTQFVVFSIPSWEHRIYLYEPGLYLRPRFPALNGIGQKIKGVFVIKPSRHIVLETQVGGIFRKEPGKNILEAGMQLRFTF
jgi:hypothetical protein